MLNVPVNNFSVISGRSQRLLGITSTFGEKKVSLDNTTEVGFEPLTSGLEIIFGTYSSCGASGLNFSLVLTPVALVLK